MKTIQDLNLAIANLTAAVDALPGRLPAPVDLTAQVDAIDAQTARINAINPATP